jgi:type VI secretion system secreted protein Hcp
MAVDIFLKLSNNIKGESQDAVHKDEIDVLSWSWHMSNSGTTHMGAGGGGGKVDVGNLSLTKYVDLSSNDLVKKCANGTHIDTGLLTVRKSGGDAPVEYFKLNLAHIMVASYDTGGSKDGLDRIVESLSLNFRKFEITYTLQEANGVAGAEALAGWDVAGNEPWSS